MPAPAKRSEATSSPSIEVSTCTVRIFNPDGTVVDVTTTPELAAELGRLEHREAMRERRHQQRQRTFTDLAVKTVSRHERAPDFGSQQIDPRSLPSASPWRDRHFQHLLGIDTIWPGPRLDDVAPLMRERLLRNPHDEWARIVRPGPDELCDACGGRPLNPFELCIRCCRTGRDRGWLEAALAETPMAPAADGLAGGTGPAEPEQPFSRWDTHRNRRWTPKRKKPAKSQWRLELDRLKAAPAPSVQDAPGTSGEAGR